MKKIVNVLLVLVVLGFCANPLFAAPSEQVVEEVMGEVMYVYMQTGGASALIGGINHPNMTFKKDKKKGTIITYKNFPTKDIIESYNAAALSEDEKAYPVHFDYMSGPISMKMNGLLSLMGEGPTNMEINVKLKGGTGKVKTFYLRMKYKRKDDTTEVSEVIIKANGKRYRNLEKAFKEGEKEM